MAEKNVVVAQSGGPSPVINNSLRAVVETCREFPQDFGTVYGDNYKKFLNLLKKDKRVDYIEIEGKTFIVWQCTQCDLGNVELLEMLLPIKVGMA